MLADIFIDFLNVVMKLVLIGIVVDDQLINVGLHLADLVQRQNQTVG